MTVTTQPFAQPHRSRSAVTTLASALASPARHALRTTLTAIVSLSVLIVAAGAIALTIAAVGATVTHVTW